MKSELDFSGKTVLVVGGSSGIGNGIAQAFRAALRDVGVSDELVHFEIFDAGHLSIDYRYPMSLAWLCGRMTK